MKKILAISSAFFMMMCILTGCGSNRNEGRNDGSYYEHYDYGRTDQETLDDHSRDNVDGVRNAGETIVTDAGNAVKDIVSGAGSVANDVIDGIDGTSEQSTRTTTTVTTER